MYRARDEIVIKDRWWQRHIADMDKCSAHGHAPFDLKHRGSETRATRHFTFNSCDCAIGLEQQLSNWVKTLKPGDRTLIYLSGCDPKIGVVRRVITQGALIHEGTEFPLPVVQLEDESFFAWQGTQIVHPSCVPNLLRPIEDEDIQRIERRDLAKKLASRDFSSLSLEKLRAIDQILVGK